MEEELRYGRVGREICYHDGRATQTIETTTENFILTNPKDIDFAAKKLTETLLEAFMHNYSEIGINVELNNNKGIKLIRLSKAKKTPIEK